MQVALHKLWGQCYRAVAHYLHRLKKEKLPSIETVHQMRVWARRTAAVVDLFGPAKPDGPWKKLRKHLKKIRKHGDDVRDYDVLWDQIRKSKAFDDDFKATWKRRRRLARKRLAEAAHSKSALKDGPKRLKHEAEAVLKMRDPSRKEPFRHLARRKLRATVRGWLRQGSADLKQPAELHEFRIAGKRLRYALEVCGPVLPQEQVRQIYEDLNKLHIQLGKICDIRAAVERYEGLYEEAASHQRKALAKFVRRERRELASEQRAFMKHWTKEIRKGWESECRKLLK